MKKIITFFVIIIAILGMFWYIYMEAKISKNEKIAFNNSYENLLDKQINGSDLASIINKAIDYNENNNIEKNKNGIYLSNNENSLSIEIKFIDSDSIIKFEKIFQNGIAQFIDLYSNSHFQLKSINYHNSTSLVSYLYFEEV